VRRENRNEIMTSGDGSGSDIVADAAASRWRVPAAALPEDVAAMLAGRAAGQLNLYRALANSAAVVRAWRDFLWSLRDDCISPRTLREIAILRTAVRHSSQYEWVHHASMAVAAGVDARVVASLGRWRDTDTLSDDERLVLELADALCDGRVPQALAETAVQRFGAEQYVELVVTIGTYVMVPRVLDALGVPTEDGAGAPSPLPAAS
jgi:4-carboxymuconolactone decarboxylase